MIPHYLHLTETLLGYHSLTSHCYFSSSGLLLVSLYRQWFYWNCWVVRSLLTEDSESSISVLFILYSSAIILHRMHVFHVTMQAQLIPSPVAIYLPLQPACISSIIISDPQMTLRDSCYLNICTAADRVMETEERGSRRVGVEWSGEMERWRSTQLTTSFFCSCIMHATAVHISTALWTCCI